ncbi:uncharacterized protein LOC118438774 [Folsomia candida]|uniref:uncharacterized protein LOC118438774 n=1 Tax=Folsomia candida TaxID=158441 RepID=UPI001604AA5C|nr:uncharacterized protein LOC118438774 [Folsomia candida]
MELRFFFVNLIGLICSLELLHLLPTVCSESTASDGNILFSKLLKNWELGKYRKHTFTRDRGDAKLSELEMPDVQFIMEYGNSLMKTGDREGKQYLQPGRCRRDPWHDQMDKFLLSYYITNQYGGYGFSGSPRGPIIETFNTIFGPRDPAPPPAIDHPGVVVDPVQNIRREMLDCWSIFSY